MGGVGRLALGYAGAAVGGPIGGIVGTLLGGWLFPAQEEHKPTKIATLRMSFPQKGAVLPVVYGTRKVEGKYIDYVNFQEHQPSGGGGKKGGGGKGGGGKGTSNQAPTYSAGLALAICEGTDDPVNEPLTLLRIWAGKDVVWENPVLSTAQGATYTEYLAAYGASPSWTVQHPPVLANSDSVIIQTATQTVRLARTTGAPGVGQYALTTTTSETGGESGVARSVDSTVVVLGPPPASLDPGSTGLWSGQVVTIVYQQGITTSGGAALGQNLNFIFYDGRPGQTPDPYLAQFRSGQAQTTGTFSGLSPQIPETFSANGATPTYSVKAVPVGPGTTQVYATLSSGARFYLTQEATSIPPSAGGFSVNLATGLITLGPPPTEIGGSAWSGQTITVLYQQALGQKVVSVGAIAYPHNAYIVLPDYDMGNAPSPPNWQFEVSHLVIAPTAAPAWGQVRGYAIPSGHAYMSVDGATWGSPLRSGATWTTFWVDENSVSDTGILTNACGIDSLNTLFSTIDAGNSWQQAGALPIGFADHLCAILPDGTLVLVQTDYPPAVYISTNGGATWSHPIPLPDVQGDPGSPYEQKGGKVFGNIQRDSKGNLYLCGCNPGPYGSGGQRQFIVWRSTDGGRSWSTVFNQVNGAQELYSPNPYVAALSYKKTANGDVLLFVFGGSLGNDGGSTIIRSTDGVNWTEVFSSAFTYHAAFSNISTIPYRWYRNNPAWVSTGDWIYYCYTSGPITPHAFRSPDNGVTWNLDDGSVIPFQPGSPNGLQYTMLAWGLTGKISAAGNGIPFCDQVPSGGGAQTPRSVNLTWGATFNEGGDAPNVGLYYSTDGARTWTSYTTLGDATFASFFSPPATFPLAISNLDINPVWADMNFITHTRYGLAIPCALIDPVTYRAAYLFAQRQGLLVSPMLDSAQSGLRHVEELLSYFDGYHIASQGLIKFGYRAPFVADHTFDFADYVMEQLPAVSRKGPRDTHNRVMVEWSPRSSDYKPAFAKLDDDNSIKDTGERALQISLLGVTTLAVAQQLTIRAFLSHRGQSLAMKHGLEPKWGPTEAGDTYAANAPGLSVTDTTFRIVGITEDPLWGLAVDSVEDPYALVPAAPSGASVFPVFAVQISGAGGGTPPPGLVSPTLATVVELPTAITNGALRLGVLAAGSGTGWIGAQVQISRDGIEYVTVGTITASPFGVLTAPFPDGVTEVPVDLSESDQMLPTLSDDAFYSLQQPLVLGATLAGLTPPGPTAAPGYEIAAYQKATLISNYRYTLSRFLRGAFYTPVVAWPSGTQFAQASAAMLSVPFAVQDVGRALYFKFVPLARFGSTTVSLPPTYLVYVPQGLGLSPAPVADLTVMAADGVTVLGGRGAV